MSDVITRYDPVIGSNWVTTLPEAASADVISWSNLSEMGEAGHLETSSTSRWQWKRVIAGTVAAVVVPIALAGWVHLVRNSDQTDDRAYDSTDWSYTPEQIFARRPITLPKCTDGRMRYWAGGFYLEVYLRITASPACIDQVIKVNHLSSSEPTTIPPLGIDDEKAAEFGWKLPTLSEDTPADRQYTWHQRNGGQVQYQGGSRNDTGERSLYLRIWHM